MYWKTQKIDERLKTSSNSEYNRKEVRGFRNLGVVLVVIGILIMSAS